MEKFSTWILGTSMLFLASCQSHMAVLQQDKHESSVAYHEVRAELADLKHAVSNAQVEIQILEERLQSQEALIQKTKTGPVSSSLDNKASSLEKRLFAIEQIQDKIQADLKQLSSHANQTSSCLQQYSAKISGLEQNVERQNKMIYDLSDLKSSLKTLKTSIAKETSSTYTVKSGDSLEKIARNHQVSTDALKKANQLSQNKILIGQELIIPPTP
ncbi:MAG: LysM peptidoglycan-binding domain-containing protein [Rhabdochlamydiaceae bacterium]|nr:LysM peptidoglycan-binding domain-containing protein [Rhabdochlamydiaceae bacterium]